MNNYIAINLINFKFASENLYTNKNNIENLTMPNNEFTDFASSCMYKKYDLQKSVWSYLNVWVRLHTLCWPT